MEHNTFFDEMREILTPAIMLFANKLILKNFKQEYKTSDGERIRVTITKLKKRKNGL